ncbi:L,D-transpeptidase family protein [Algimonas arctica]|uniref:L,D-transpeptidase family protein n=1 Tax=Algimonas arctica TaxID=1479486 RepID=UPI00167BCFC7|nr:L,D-transpeptidase family protein [Algimonas arctica]
MNEPLQFDTKTRRVTLGHWAAPFGLGRDGTISACEGREGDAKTPLGSYVLRFGLYRADRLPDPASPLTMHPLHKDDAWCDAPNDPAYNRFVKRPYAGSHEVLWREDSVYDVILVMSHNDSPPVAGLGSAVFIHCRQPDHRPTLGCLALAAPDMWTLLPNLKSGLSVEVI